MAMPRPLSVEFRYGVARAASTSLPAHQTLAFHAPDQELDAILAEERFVLEHEGRHAPMAGGGMVLLVSCNQGLVLVGIGLDRLVHGGEIEAGSSCRTGEMI